MTQPTRPNQPSSLTLTATSAAVTEMEQFVKERSILATASLGSIQRALVVAEAVGKLRPFIKSQLHLILPLRGNRLGFLTDKDKPRKGQPAIPYDNETVVDCCCEALLRGLNLTGNEFNIIAGGCMTVKNGWARLIAQTVSGMTDFDPIIHVPIGKSGGVVVPCEATWRMFGTPVKIVREYVLKQDSWTTLDALMGKAERRLFRDCYFRMTGSATWAEPEDETDGLVDIGEGQVGSRTQQVAGQLAQKTGNGQHAITSDNRMVLIGQLNDTLRHFSYTEEEFQQVLTGLSMPSADKMSTEQIQKVIEFMLEAGQGGDEPSAAHADRVPAG